MVAYLLAAALFELVLALRHEIGPHGEGFVLLGALLAMVVGTVLVVRGVGPAAFIAPAAALFVAARFYTGDPYDAPYFQSYADGGFPLWMFVLLGAAIVTGVTAYAWRRTRRVESVAVLVLLLFTAMFMGTH
jgi:hypothetical protein